MSDLKTLIRGYAAAVEEGQEPITIEEVGLRRARREGTDPIVGLRPSSGLRTPPRRRGPAVLAVMVILIIFGVFALVFPGAEPPSADTLSAPTERELGYYMPAEVPAGFVLQDMETSRFNASLIFVRETPGAWLPGDGGFQIGVPFISSAGFPEDAAVYLNDIVESNRGADRIDLGGRPGVIREIRYVDEPVDTTLVSLVMVDERGGVFEIMAVGMTRDEVLSVARDVERVSVEEFVALGSDLEWEVRMLQGHDGFEYEIPDQLENTARSVDVVLGLDVLARSSIARPAGNESPVTTTEDGSVAEPTKGSWTSSSASIYLDIPDDEVDRAYEALRGERIVVSPRVADEFTDRYVKRVRDGVVLSEDPYVIQAPRGPEPQFDTASLGEELPLEPATTADALPQTMFSGLAPLPLASEDRPVIVIGTVARPESGPEPVTVILWFTESGAANVSLMRGGGMGSSGGIFPLEHYGIIGESRTSYFAMSHISYAVPLDTAVVQITTEEVNFWQRPAAGHGAISYKYTGEGRPISIIAYDTEGSRLGEWEVPPE